MSVDGQLFEINSLDKEIVRLRKKIRELQERRKKLEAQVVDYLQNRNEEELNYNGKVYKLEEKVRRTRKKESDRKRDVMAVISEHLENNEDDVTNTEQIYSAVIGSLQGPEKMDYRLVTEKKS